MGRCGSVGVCRVAWGMTLNLGHLSVTCVQTAWNRAAFLQLDHCFGTHSQFILYTAGKGFGPSGILCLHWCGSAPMFCLQSWSPVVNTKCFPEISLLKKKIKIKMGDWLLIISVFIRASCGHRQNKDCNRAEEWESSKDTRSDFSGGIALREAPLLHWGMDSLTLWADDLWPSGSEEGKQLWEHKCSPAVERGEAKGCALQYPTTLWAGCTTVSLWGQVHPMLMKELNKNTSSCCLGLLNCLGRVELSATALTLDFFTPGSQSGMLHTYLVSWWIQWRGRFCLWSWQIDKVSLYILSHTYIGIQTLQRICELSITVLCMGSNTSEFLWCWSQLRC